MKSFREHQIHRLLENLENCDIQEGINNQLEILRLELIESSKLPELIAENLVEQSQWSLVVEQDHHLQRYVIDNTIRCAKESLYDILTEADETKVSLEDLHVKLMDRVKKMFGVIRKTVKDGMRTGRGDVSSPSGEDEPYARFAPSSASRGTGGSVMGATPPPATSAAPSPDTGNPTYSREHLPSDRPEVGGYKPASMGSVLPGARNPGESWWSRLKGGLRRSIIDPIANLGPVKKFRRRWHNDPSRPMAKESQLQFNTMLLESEMNIDSVIDNQLLKFDSWLKSILGHLAKSMKGFSPKIPAVVDPTTNEPESTGLVGVGIEEPTGGETSTGEKEEDVVSSEPTELERRAAQGDPEAKQEVLRAYEKFKRGAAKLGMEARIRSNWGINKGTGKDKKNPKFNRSQLFVNGQPIQGSGSEIGRMVYEKIYTDILGGEEPPETQKISAKVRHKVNDYLGLHGSAGTFPQITAAIMRLAELDAPTATKEPLTAPTSTEEPLTAPTSTEEPPTAPAPTEELPAVPIEDDVPTGNSEVDRLTKTLKVNGKYEQFLKMLGNHDVEEMVKSYGADAILEALGIKKAPNIKNVQKKNHERSAVAPVPQDIKDVENPKLFDDGEGGKTTTFPSRRQAQINHVKKHGQPMGFNGPLDLPDKVKKHIDPDVSKPGKLTKNTIVRLKDAEKENFKDLEASFGGPDGLSAEISKRLADAGVDESKARLARTEQEDAAIKKIIADLTDSNVLKAEKKSKEIEGMTDKAKSKVAKITKWIDELEETGVEGVFDQIQQEIGPGYEEDLKEIKKKIKSNLANGYKRRVLQNIIDAMNLKDKSQNLSLDDDDMKSIYGDDHDRQEDSTPADTIEELPPTTPAPETALDKPKLSPEEFAKQNKKLMIDDGGENFQIYKKKMMKEINGMKDLDSNEKIDAIERIKDVSGVDEIEGILSDVGIDSSISDKIVDSITIGESTMQQTIDFYKKLLKEEKKPTRNRLQELREKLLNS